MSGERFLLYIRVKGALSFVRGKVLVIYQNKRGIPCVRKKTILVNQSKRDIPCVKKKGSYYISE